MKRLLAYLIVVISFGLTFSVSAEAAKWEIIYKNYLDGNIYSSKHNKKDFADLYAYQKCVKDKLTVKGQSKRVKKIINNVWSYGPATDRAKYCLQYIIIDPKGFEKIIWNASDKSRVAEVDKQNKKEPSQTQKVAKKERHICVVWQVSSYLITEYQEGDFDQRCTEKFYKSKNPKLYNKFMQVMLESSLSGSIPKNTIISLQTFNDLKGKTQIAKVEPSQTQKVAGKNIYFCDNTNTTRNQGVDYFISSTNSCKPKNSGYQYSNGKRISEEKYILELLDINKNTKKDKFLKIRTDQLVQSFELRGLNTESIFNILNNFDNQTQIAKKGSTVKPKKKVKVAKVEDSTQEEFKPKKTNQDNEAPIITIAEAITVDSQAYTLKGKVRDKSQIYLTIDGRQVDVTKGKFELDRFSINSDATEEIKIVAIDKWNNRSEKIVKVTIDLQSSNVAKVYEGLQPNNIKVKTDNNKIAIIIGIEKYANLKNLDAKYANRDAQAFRTYATRALGIKPSNIKVLIDDKANRGNTLEAFKIWLPKKAGKGGKDIHIFFAGHGLASENGKDLYILPQDGNAKLLDDTAITRVELISLINKVNPKSVTMFFDTCYSGQTRDERMLVASLLRPIQIISEEQDTPDNFTIFSASDYDQVSGGIEEAKHGMFSYYLMKGLEGNADDNKDKKITNGELITYLKDNVSEEAFTQNREQDPMLAGDPDKILISYQ